MFMVKSWKEAYFLVGIFFQFCQVFPDMSLIVNGEEYQERCDEYVSSKKETV